MTFAIFGRWTALLGVALILGCGDSGPQDASTLGNRGVKHIAAGEFDEAIDDLTKVIRIDPNDAMAYYNRGAAYLGKRDYARAIADFTEAIRFHPNDAESFQYRGLAYIYREEYPKAIADFTEAIRLNPRSPLPYDSLATLRATCPVESIRDGKEAVLAATKACELTAWKEWKYIDRLAAAYAESGDFERAVAFQQQAMNFVDANQNREQMMIRMTLYSQRQPYRSRPQ